jgi:hypothetical protein
LKTCGKQMSPRRKMSKVKFSPEDTTFVIPVVEENMISNLWWSPHDMTKFRKRQSTKKNIESNAPDITLVITNDPSRRKVLASTTTGLHEPKSKFVSCGHDKVNRAFNMMNLKFQFIVIDGDDANDCVCTADLVRSFCPEATILTIHTDFDNNITAVQSC